MATSLFEVAASLCLSQAIWWVGGGPKQTQAPHVVWARAPKAPPLACWGGTPSTIWGWHRPTLSTTFSNTSSKWAAPAAGYPNLPLLFSFSFFPFLSLPLFFFFSLSFRPRSRCTDTQASRGVLKWGFQIEPYLSLSPSFPRSLRNRFYPHATCACWVIVL